MKNKFIILRYGEINLKGKNRNFFDRILKNNIKNKIQGKFVNIDYLRNRVIIEVEEENIDYLFDSLKKLPGIENLSIAQKTNSTYDCIKQLVLEVFDQSKPVFRVSTKRSDKNFPFNSQEMSKKIGGEILRHYDGLENIRVSMKKFEQEISIEILSDFTYIIHNTAPGMGGLPVGSSGKGVVLLSGGIDSPVSAIEAMKRGIKIDCVHFHTPPYTTPRALEKVADLVKVLQEYDSSISLITYNITDLQLDIKDKCKDSYALILMRRMMFRITSKLCLDEGYQMIITGESIGQVASQTIENISLTNMLSAVPVIRPLITMNKNEIITKAKKYNTYEISIEPYDDACSVFAPKRPIIKGVLEDVVKEESKFDVDKYLNTIQKEEYQVKEENLLDEFL